MIANVTIITLVLFLAIAFTLLERLRFLAPFRKVILAVHQEVIIVYLVPLFFNIFTESYSVYRQFFFKDTGKKLKAAKQLDSEATDTITELDRDRSGKATMPDSYEQSRHRVCSQTGPALKPAGPNQRDQTELPSRLRFGIPNSIGTRKRVRPIGFMTSSAISSVNRRYTQWPKPESFERFQSRISKSMSTPVTAS